MSHQSMCRPTACDPGDGAVVLPSPPEEVVGDGIEDLIVPPPPPMFMYDCVNDVDDYVDRDVTLVKCASVHASISTDDDFTHIQPVIDKLPDSLTAQQRQQAIDLIKRNADVFGRHEFDVGCTDLLTARIITDPNRRPIAEPLRRHAKVHLDTIDDTIEKMKQAGIVEDACSPWSANLVVVGRKDDQGRPTTPRVTIDFRGLNAITYRDRHPIPHMGDCLRSLDKAVFMSIIDLSNSFYQLPIDPQDRDKTAFLTRKGQFRLTRLGQGCTNSPAVFCRLMAMVLRGLTCCLAYIDDTICFSPSFERHLVDLEAVFDRFRQANLKLKSTKCKLFQTRCKFVGHYVSENGIEVMPEKVACVVGWPFPKTITELRSFLGLCSYYRSFCKGYATIAEPLTQCLRKDVMLTQTPERIAAFDKLKEMLTNTPVLAMPRDDPECTYLVDTDASSVGAGCVLQQWQDGRLRVIEYASRTFNKAERNYCVTRRELAALIFGLKQFRSYLLGRRFQVRVDNNAIRYYQSMKDATGQCARHLDYLSNFDFDIIHRNGLRHTNCDSLSRLRPCELDDGGPCRQCSKRVTGQHSVKAVKTRRKNANDTKTRTGRDPPRVAAHCPVAVAESVVPPRYNVADRPQEGCINFEAAPALSRPSRHKRLPLHLKDYDMAASGRDRLAAATASGRLDFDRQNHGNCFDTAALAGDRLAAPGGTRQTNVSSDWRPPVETAAAASRGRLAASTESRRPPTGGPNEPDVNNPQPKTRRRRRQRRTVPSLEATAPGACEAVGDWTPDAIRDAQLRDPDIGPAVHWAEIGERPPWTDVEASSPMLRALWQQYDSLTVKDGILYRSFYDSKGQITFYQLVLPFEMKVPFLELIHADTACHLKFAKCIPHVMRRAWWLNWKRDLNLFIRCCPRCEGFHRGNPPKQARLRPMMVGAPGERFAIDLCGPFPSSDGFRYLFTAICVFSKFGICVPLRNKEAITVAKALVDHVFLKYGLCTEILSDLGLEFQNEVMTELFNILGVSRLRTSGYRPQSNGQCEVWHRTLNSMIAKTVDEGQRNWSSLIPYVTFCYNATEHSATGFPPFFIFTGRMPLWTVDLVLPEAGEDKKTVPEYTASVVDKLQKASALVRQNLQMAASTASNWYNRKVKPRSFNTGDKVRIFYPRKRVGRTPKWQSFYRTEGHVLQKINDATYVVSSPQWRENKVVHVDKLRPILTFPSGDCNRMCAVHVPHRPWRRDGRNPTSSAGARGCRCF